MSVDLRSEIYFMVNLIWYWGEHVGTDYRIDKLSYDYFGRGFFGTYETLLFQDQFKQLCIYEMFFHVGCLLI